MKEPVGLREVRVGLPLPTPSTEPLGRDKHPMENGRQEVGSRGGYQLR